MKKLLTILIITISLNSFGQSKPDTIAQKVPDSIRLISSADVYKILDESRKFFSLEQVDINQWQAIAEMINQLVLQRKREWYFRGKPQN